MRTALAVIGLVLSVGASAGSIRIQFQPPRSVADGKSTVTVTAEIRDESGNLVPDGTGVRFTTSAGSFRAEEGRTVGGIARVVLVAPDAPGVVTVKASSIANETVNTADIEFVGDRSMLTTARQYVDVSCTESLFFSSEIKVISAGGKGRAAVLKYRDVHIEASDMQVDLNQMRVLAQDAKLSVGETTIECDFLRYGLVSRRGVAIATVEGRKGGYEIVGGSTKLSDNGVQPTEFVFADVGRAPSSIHAERIVAFPGRETQFYHAKMYVGDTKVMSFPLYSLSASSQGGLFTDQIVGVQNGGVQINYPHYLQLSPQLTSVLRLRSGSMYARGSGSSRGFFLDWENKYLLGDRGEGTLTLGGIGRKDMGLSWRHLQQFDDRTYVNASLDTPSLKSIYGGLNATRSFNGFSANFTASTSRSFSGTHYESRNLDFSVETDSARIGNLPVTGSLGFVVNSANATFGPTNTRREGVGFRSRFLLLPQKLFGSGSLSGGVTVTQLWGNRADAGLGVLANLGVSSPLGRNASLRLTYNYAQDSLNTAITGRHRIGTDFAYDGDRFSLSLLADKSLDIDSYSILADGFVNLSKLWRIGGSLSLDHYLGTSVNDETLVLGYRLGMREVGLTYSINRRKFGFQLLNASFRY
jgi:hypothetical protein